MGKLLVSLTVLWCRSFALPAHAAGYDTNTDAVPWAERVLSDGTGRLDTIRKHFCGSGHQEDLVDEAIEPAVGFSLDIDHRNAG